MDADLVMRAQRGDQRAFGALAERHYARLQRAAVAILRDPHVAEDATQNALVAVWRDLPKLRDPASFESWSYRVLVRACYAEARRVPRTLPDEAKSRAEEPVMFDAYGGVVHRDELERGFRRLSIDHRAVVVLRHLLDLPVEQVADTLGIPVGTVKSRLSRALEVLRSAIEADARAPAPAVSREEATP